MRGIDLALTIVTTLGVAGMTTLSFGGAAVKRARIEYHLWFLTGNDETSRRLGVEIVATIGPRAVPRLIEEARVAQPFMPEQAVLCLERMFGFVLTPGDPHYRFWDRRTIDLWVAWYQAHESTLRKIGEESEAFGVPFPQHYRSHRDKPPAPGGKRTG